MTGTLESASPSNIWEGIGDNNTQWTNLEKNHTKTLPANPKTSENYYAP